ncbi:MAG: transcriptional repressor [Pyrinomonadaceae bacterium]|nr:transcriptional repressor [Pyrinomonadaceae bacterium]
MSDTTTEKIETGLTKQRAIVLEVIKSADDHLTANEIFDQAKTLLPGISFATVYNSLRFLKEGGFIAEKNFGSGASRFDRMTTRHDHAVCISCEKLIDMELEIPQELIDRAAEFSKFSPESVELTLRGLCPECNKK